MSQQLSFVDPGPGKKNNVRTEKHTKDKNKNLINYLYQRFLTISLQNLKSELLLDRQIFTVTYSNMTNTINK